ncbi:unnamed protein product [Caenorhabditis auriculariae]|uniref:valine--tRNA ligase n=1 Tax=Caenorhabditis auriculariae TaxID=2777116 RepID=A0A8S1HM22_9PELO|nr:unnamed protein product [Caenorhabditis auriculariae]
MPAVSMLKCRRHVNLLRVSFRKASSFDIDTVTADYEQRTHFASQNYRRKGNVFRMVLPPPNVTGKLHLGHALTVSIEDAICRQNRIQGGIAQWLPGFDHAGIATQAAVEKELFKRKGISRKDLSREEFVKHCQDWSEKCSTEIRNQLTRLGATLDWDNSYYTLDNNFSSAVTSAFCNLHDDGLIFRGKRLINWCPSLSSALSDQEVDRIDVPPDGLINIPKTNSREMRQVKVGTMHLIRYKFTDSNDFLEVGTTRPETLFADVALAVNPNDQRFSKYIGKLVYSPVDPSRKLPILADSAVNPEKGTGVLKITPFHDPLDFAVAERHEKEIDDANPGILMSNKANCIDSAGRLENTGTDLDGIDRFEAREKVIKLLSDYQLYGGTIRHTGAQVNICSRTGDIIEPRLMEQWFLDVKDLHQQAKDLIINQKVIVKPSYQTHRLLDWFENTDPWCLSRQLLWGHRIPAYTSAGSNWVVAKSESEAREKLSLDDNSSFRQDEDVLDTWFSSALVPLVTLGWNGSTDLDLSDVPIDVMETGWDISGFWVARMMAMHLRLTRGTPPFKQIVLHGLVRDSEGRKMSKSLGNVIDPLDVLDGIGQEKMKERILESSLAPAEKEKACADIEKRFPEGIPRCGPDALRYALLKYDVMASDVPIDVASMATEGLRFCNKLWNLAAYYDQLKTKCRTRKDVDTDRSVDEWLLSRFASTVAKVDEHMKAYELHLALSALHSFVTSDVCDTYLETTKQAFWSEDVARIEQARSTLQRVLQPTFVQLSVFMPFVSELLYERMFSRERGSILFDVVKPSLFFFHRNEELDQGMKLLLAAVAATRSIRSKLQLPANLVFNGILAIEDPSLMIDGATLKSLADDVTSIGRLSLSHVVYGKLNTEERGLMALPVAGHNASIWLKIDENSRSEFVDCLKKQLEKTKSRERQFLEKAESYSEMQKKPENLAKTSALKKLQRKAEQARQVAANSSDEAKRIELIIAEQNS